MLKMSDKPIEQSLIEKARAIGIAARGGQTVSQARSVSPTHSPTVKVEKQAENDTKHRSLPKEQQQQRSLQSQQRPTGRTGR
jgi:hypothetical protein